VGAQDEQLEKMALLAAQMDALRKKFENQCLTTEERDARISEMLREQLDLEAALEKVRLFESLHLVCVFLLVSAAILSREMTMLQPCLI
jgi:hypothetical protein